MRERIPRLYDGNCEMSRIFGMSSVDVVILNAAHRSSQLGVVTIGPVA